MKIVVKTQKEKEVVDITQRVRMVLDEHGVENGLCHVFVTHTTAAVTTADLDPGTDQDMMEALTGMLPDINYRHPHNPDHAPDHILSSIVGPGVTVPLGNGSLVLGTWQRVVLVEFNGPRERTVIIRVVS